MGEALIPKTLRSKYEIFDWNHAIAILTTDFPAEWSDIVEVLDGYVLRRSDVISPGKNKSPISHYLDHELYARGWEEKKFDIRIKVDAEERETPTHKIDCYKNKVGVEIEWNNKDPFFDRDLNNFRLLFDLKTISVGVIITRSTKLQQIFNDLGKGQSYGNSTTHMEKLKPRILGGGGGGCPILVFAINPELYDKSN